MRSARAQTESNSVRKISLITNDIIYNSADQTLYASVPSSAGNIGNSITQINPRTGVVGNSVFVGSEPNKLALANDNRTMYVALDGAFAIRRFDTLTQTPGLQFATGRDSNYGLYQTNDLAVAPGNPDLVAIARSYRGVSPSEAGVAVFDNGVQRPQTGPGHIDGSDYLAFSATADTLYGGGYYGGLRTMTVDGSGVTVINMTNFSVGARIKFDNGLIFSSTGQVINPQTRTLLGTFSGANSNVFVPDSSVGRAYYLARENYSGPLTLKPFDINTFTPVGSVVISDVTGDPTS